MTGPSPTPFPIPNAAARAAARATALLAPILRGGALRRWTAIAALGLSLSGLAACTTTTPDFEDVGPADELYAEGLEILEGWRLFWVMPIVN